VNGIPAVRRCADAILQAGLRDVVVVTGANSAAVEEAIRDLPVRIVRNEHPGGEMIDSVRAGLRATLPQAPAVLLCLADHPLVLPATIRTIIGERDSFPDRIVIPLHQGRRGHPTLFPRQLIGQVLSGTTLRDVIQANADRIRLVEVDDVGIALDLDTQEDYADAVRIAAQRS